MASARSLFSFLGSQLQETCGLWNLFFGRTLFLPQRIVVTLTAIDAGKRNMISAI
jgi:hypothetical protein